MCGRIKGTIVAAHDEYIMPRTDSAESRGKSPPRYANHHMPIDQQLSDVEIRTGWKNRR